MAGSKSASTGFAVFTPTIDVAAFPPVPTSYEPLDDYINKEIKKSLERAGINTDADPGRQS